MTKISLNNSEKNPLVSIIIITYNSAKYVLETLESAKAQTYKNIELIVSDDGSTDKTLEICKNWIENNKERFVKTELISVEENTGIPANCNRGLSAAKGEWIKFIAGDDILLPNCILDNINFVQTNKNINVLFSAVERYINTFSINNYYKRIPEKYPNDFYNENISAYDQYKMLLLGDRIAYTPSIFIKRDILFKVGLFDERFKLIEDYPMWLRLTKSGIRLFFMDKVTVFHRISENSIHNNMKKNLVNVTFLRNEELRKIYVYPNINLKEKFLYKYDYISNKFLILIFRNKINFISKSIRFILFKILRPILKLILINV